MTDLIAHIQELKTKADRYDAYAQDRLKMAEKIQNAIQTLNEVAEALKPTVKITIQNQHQRGYLKQITLELLETMNSGTTITRHLIETVYTNLTAAEINRILTKLSKINGVQKAYDGRKIRLFKRVTDK